MKITYFVHGTTTDNEEGRATGWLPGELSELGIKQSKELPSQIADNSFDVVFCSDLKRAVDSAQISFGKTHTIIQDKRLREANYGDFNGKEETFKDKIKEFIEKPFPNGESFIHIEKRIADFLEFLKKHYSNKHVAIVAHQAPQLALEVLCNHKTWEQAFDTDWRKFEKWQPGWKYNLE